MVPFYVLIKQHAGIAALPNRSQDLAKSAAASPWTDEMSRRALAALVATGDDFRQSGVADHSQARRAERLVLALDRLLATRKGSQPNNYADANLNRLFTLAQSLPDFNSSEFATALNQFAKSLNP